VAAVEAVRALELSTLEVGVPPEPHPASITQTALIAMEFASDSIRIRYTPFKNNVSQFEQNTVDPNDLGRRPGEPQCD
jgi:hypothetical protein